MENKTLVLGRRGLLVTISDYTKEVLGHSTGLNKFKGVLELPNTDLK